MFNSEEYAWKDMNVVVAGRAVTGITGLSYTTERVAEYNYGAGDNPHSVQKGNKSYPGEITLNQSEIESLIRSVREQGAEDPTDISFDIIANYAKGVADSQVTDALRGCHITSLPKGWNQGETKMNVTLPLMILKIEYDI